MSDYNFLMESRLSPEQYQLVTRLSRIAATQGVNIYLVGGAVRDLTLSQATVRDLDFAVEGGAQKILRQLEAGKAAPSSADGTPAEAAPLVIESRRIDTRRDEAEIVLTNGVRAGIAATRKETYSKPGARPEISKADIFEDLQRRDFSMNAMGLSLHPNSRGLLLDPTNGVADLERREIRALHSRSFLDDPSRLYRLLRFQLRLDLKVEERTQRWMESALESRAWERLDSEQQGSELRAILQEENPARVLKLLAERKLLAGLDSKLASARPAYDAFEKVRSAARLIPRADTLLVNFHALVAKLPASQRQRLARKILGDAKLVKMALGLELEARKLARELGGPKTMQPSQIYRLLNGKPQRLLLFLLAYYPQSRIQTRVRNFLLKYPEVRAKLPRAELQMLGLEHGPQFEKILEQIFLDQLDGKLKTPQQVAKALRELSGIKPPAAAEKARKGQKTGTPAKKKPASSRKR